MQHTASKRRGNSLEGLKGAYLKAKAFDFRMCAIVTRQRLGSTRLYGTDAVLHSGSAKLVRLHSRFSMLGESRVLPDENTERERERAAAW